MAFKSGLFVSTASAAIAATILAATQSQAATLALDGEFTLFNFGDVGSVSDRTFQFEVAPGTQVVFDVTDAYLAGDIFEVVDATLGSLGTTAFVPADAGNSQLDPGLTYTDSSFSSGTFLLGSGSFDISIVAVESPFNSGTGYVRGNVIAVPEPLTILGTATAAGIGMIFRRRFSEA